MAQFANGVTAHSLLRFVNAPQEHPQLGAPAYCVHPCRTPELLRTLRAAATDGDVSGALRTNVIATCLSALGPLAGLRLSIDCALQS